MSLPIALGVYFICWWLAFFIMLPLGVHTQSDAGSVEPGTADSAPIAPKLWFKVVGATIVSAVIFGIVYAVVAYRLIPLDRVPMSL